MNGSKRRHGGTRSLLSASRARLVAACVLVFVVDFASARIGGIGASKVLATEDEPVTVTTNPLPVNVADVRDLLLQSPHSRFVRVHIYIVFVYL